MGVGSVYNVWMFGAKVVQATLGKLSANLAVRKSPITEFLHCYAFSSSALVLFDFG